MTITADNTATTTTETTEQSNNLHLIPELAPHWQGFDFREILSRPAAFVSISQSNSLYRPGGVQYAEGHDKRGSLPATLKVLAAARKAENFISFNWVGVASWSTSCAPRCAAAITNCSYGPSIPPSLAPTCHLNSHASASKW